MEQQENSCKLAIKLKRNKKREGRMGGKVCICGSSALELYRSSCRLAPEILSMPRTGKLDGCGFSTSTMLKDEMMRLGVKAEPFHLLVPDNGGKPNRTDIVRCQRKGKLPSRSLVALTSDTLVTGPEMTFIDLALEKGMDEVDLALIGYEFCGTYLLDDSWDGLTNTERSLSKVSQIEKMISALDGAWGVGLARRALKLVHDGSNSPMETILCALLTFPHRLGGYALGPVSLNHQVATGKGFRYIDVAFPKHRVGLEYKGREFHSIERVGRDDRRQNEIAGAGWTMLNVWYEDLVEEHLFDRLIKELACAMGVRIRIRSASFEEERRVLRARLLPSVMKFSGTGV